MIETCLGSIKVTSHWPGAKEPLISKTSTDFQIPFKDINVYDQNENRKNVARWQCFTWWLYQHSKRKICFSVNFDIWNDPLFKFISAGYYPHLVFLCKRTFICLPWCVHCLNILQICCNVASLLQAPIKRWYMALSSTVCCWITSKPCIGEYAFYEMTTIAIQFNIMKLEVKFKRSMHQGKIHVERKICKTGPYLVLSKSFSENQAVWILWFLSSFLIQVESFDVQKKSLGRIHDTILFTDLFTQQAIHSIIYHYINRHV